MAATRDWGNISNDSYKVEAHKMTKAELIEEVSHAVEMTRKDAEVIVEAIFDSVVRALRAGIRLRCGVLEASARASGSASGT